ncbi:MAG: LruC domain-containing protein, partial [Owenweeksia sp.]
GSSADFYLNMPQIGSELFIYYPSTGDKLQVSQAGNVTMNVQTNFFDVDYSIALANADKGKKSAVGKRKAQATDLIVNGDFESGSNFSNFPYNSNLNTGEWYIQSSNRYSRPTRNGSRVFESEHNSYGYAYQLMDLNGEDTYTTTGNTSGNFCIYIFFLESDGDIISYEGYAPNNGNNIDRSGSIPANATYALIKIHGPKNQWIDNVTFEVESAIQDADNDGVGDDTDDYPNDPARAYTSYFPTDGYQTVAFEDLWPQKGDYDFNDMVLSNNVVYSSDADNNLVDAIFTVSLDAVGSGFANGLAIVFVDDNNNFISSDIIASVSGDATEDPNVTNGLIIFDHVYNAQSEYYQNNGEGPSKTPDVFTFTVTFNSNASNQNIIPDVYIFRSNDRGLEIHLDGFSGTSAANTSYYNTGFDVNGTYSTASGLPWALEVVTPDKSFEHPNEKVDILEAYPQFQTWAESGGTQALDWMDVPILEKIFNLL